MVRKKALDLVSAAAGWWDRGCRDLSSGPTTPVAGKTACGVRTAMDSSPPTMERKVVFSLQGYSIDEATATLRRAIVAAMLLSAQEERYRWLNYHLCVGEGEIDEESELWWFDIRAIANEVAVAPSKLAWAKPPWG